MFISGFIAENVKLASASRFSSGTRPKPTTSTTRASRSTGRHTVPTGTSHSSWPDLYGVYSSKRTRVRSVRTTAVSSAKSSRSTLGDVSTGARGLDHGRDVHDLLRLALERVARVAHVVRARG